MEINLIFKELYSIRKAKNQLANREKILKEKIFETIGLVAKFETLEFTWLNQGRSKFVVDIERLQKDMGEDFLLKYQKTIVSNYYFIYHKMNDAEKLAKAKVMPIEESKPFEHSEKAKAYLKKIGR